MAKEKFIACEDRIQVDDMICEMSLERLQLLKDLIQMCHDCGGCNGMLEEINGELEIRKGKK